VNGQTCTLGSTCTISSSFPSGTTNQLLYYASSGTTLTPLTLGSNLSITSGTLNAANPTFTQIGSGTNLVAAMLVGTGASLGPTGTGTVTANAITGTISAGTNVTISGSGTTGSPYVINSIGGGGGSGTVTSFSAGNLSPLFTTSVATATTTPALSFTLSNAANSTFLGNFSGSSAAPSFYTLAAGSNITITPSGSTVTIAATGGGGSGTVTDGAGTTTAGLISESTTTLHGIDYSSNLDNGHTTANTLTYSGSGGMALTGGTAHGLTIPAGTAVAGAAGKVIFASDATSGFGEMNQNAGGLERIAGWNTANIFTAAQTAPSFIATGSGAGVVTLTQGTAPSTTASSVNLIAPATVTTAYNYIYPAGPLNSANPVLEQCTGTASSLSCAPATGSVSTSLVTGTYSDISFNNTHTSGARIGLEADSSGTDLNLYYDVPTGGFDVFRINNTKGIQFVNLAGSYFEIAFDNGTPTNQSAGLQHDVSGADQRLYIASPGGTNSGIAFTTGGNTTFVVIPGTTPTAGGGCSGSVFVMGATDGHGVWCNGSSYVSRF
jgi:hypothetical protein